MVVLPQPVLQALARSPDETAPLREDDMELRENRTELERLLGDVWEYEDGDHQKTSSPKWLFALTLIGAVVCIVFALRPCRSGHRGDRACAGKAVG